jgi:hypothetical protein
METMTREEAHEAVDAAAQMGALSHLVAAWDLAGSWNGHAEWDAETLHDHIDYCASGDDQRSNGPKDSDATGLPVWEGVL